MTNKDKPALPDLTNAPVHSARRVVWRFLEKGGDGHCPVCDRRVSIDSRSFLGEMAAGLAWLNYHYAVGEFFHLPTLNREFGTFPNNDGSFLRYWGLIEPAVDHVARSNMADENTSKVGWYCLTQEGKDFAEGRTRIHKYFRQFNQQVLGLGGPLISIREVKGFRYADLKEWIEGTTRRD